MINGYDDSLPPPGSLWLYRSTSQRGDELPPEPVDVLVIGAGIAGICTAYNLGKSGLAVGLIDSHNVLTGTTGHTTAKLSVQHEMRYSPLYDRDRDIAYVYAGAQLRGERWLRQELAIQHIEADLQSTSTYLYTTEEALRSELEREVEITQELGLPSGFRDSWYLGFPDGGVGYYEMRDQAVYHPVKAMQGLLKIYLEKNWLAEGVKALEVSEEGNRCKVITTAGPIFADRVVITTHAPFNDGGKFTKRMVPAGEMVVAGPISKRLNDLPPSLSVDKNKVNHSVRTALGPGGHNYGIVLGYEHRPGTVKDLFSQHKELAAFATEVVGLEAITFRWYAHDYTTTDGVPFIGYYNEGSDKILMASGFGLWGMTNGAYASLLLTDMIMGHANEEDVAVFDPNRSSAPISMFDFPATKEAPTPVEDLEPNQATVDGDVATYQDSSGEDHSVSATCTHLGCPVAFNNTDNTWDCPCHASRYDINGKVLHGPTIVDLTG